MVPLKPTDSLYQGKFFEARGYAFFSGFFQTVDPEQWPGVVTPVLLQRMEGAWVEVKKFSTLWEGGEINNYTEKDMAYAIINFYNTYIEDLPDLTDDIPDDLTGKELYYATVASIIQSRVAVVNGLLKLD